MNDNARPSQTPWQRTPMPNLVRYGPSGTLFARVRVKGKLIRWSLRTEALSIAKLRLADLEKAERQSAEHALACDGGSMVFSDALRIYRSRLHGDASLKPRTKAHREERIATIFDGGSRHGVVGCDIYQTRQGGIHLEGGDRRTLTPAGHYADNAMPNNMFIKCDSAISWAKSSRVGWTKAVQASQKTTG